MGYDHPKREAPSANGTRRSWPSLGIESCSGRGSRCGGRQARESFACTRAVRDGFLSLPDRLAPVIVAEGDARKVQEILSNEIEQVLLGLVKRFQKEEEQASETPTPQ